MRKESEDCLFELKKLYDQNCLIPFIGSGFSIPLKLPSWKELIETLCVGLDYDKDIFLQLGSFPQLAEFVQKEYPDKWDEFILDVTTKFNSSESDTLRKNSEQYKSLALLNFKTIYTTNYDLHIENAFKDNKKTCLTISNIENLIQSNKIIHDCEVLKFHGSLYNTDSMVITESDYFERMNLEGAIDQRLRSDMLTKSFLFIGYSFSDPNIRYIFYKLHKLRKSISNKKTKLNSYIVTFGMNEIQANLLNQWDIKVIELDPSNKEKSISNLLISLL